jgi:hypothetical protein
LIKVESVGEDGMIARSNPSSTRSIIASPVRKSSKTSGSSFRKRVATSAMNRPNPWWQ